MISAFNSAAALRAFPISQADRDLADREMLLLLWLQHLLSMTLGIDQDHLEQVLEGAGKVPHHLPLKLWAWLSCSTFNCGDVVLADTEVMGKLTLGQATFLAHPFEANSTDLYFHGS